MSMNETSSGERIHISFFGKRNAGKSSLVNAVTSQNLSVVSEVKGTTTDPVKKSMELLPLGPVVITDTAGIDDEGELGSLRVQKTFETLSRTDIAVFVADATAEISDDEKKFIAILQERKIPFIIARNKCDLLAEIPKDTPNAPNEIFVSAATGINISELKERLGRIRGDFQTGKRIIADLISRGDIVVLVIPIDQSAPKGRIILPQQATIRDILDSNAIFISCQPQELKQTLESLAKKPRLVVTDSQAFGEVSKIVPREIPLTSFSILFARYKGELSALIGGAEKLSALKDGERVLIAEACTHHRQCRDIGTVQLPSMIKKFSGANVDFEFSSGTDFPAGLEKFALVVHCGGCMINETEMKNRLERAKEAGVPVVNYGIALAKMNGILERSIEPVRNSI